MSQLTSVLGKTGRGAGVGAGDQWVKSGDGNWEIAGIFPEMPSAFSRELAHDQHTLYYFITQS